MGKEEIVNRLFDRLFNLLSPGNSNSTRREGISVGGSDESVLGRGLGGNRGAVELDAGPRGLFVTKAMVSECRSRQVSQADDDDRTLTNLRLGEAQARWIESKKKGAKPGGWLGESGSRFWWNVPRTRDPERHKSKSSWVSLLALSGGEGAAPMDGISDGDGMEAVSLGAEKSWLLWSRSRTPWLVRAIRVRWMDRDVAI